MMEQAEVPIPPMASSTLTSSLPDHQSTVTPEITTKTSKYVRDFQAFFCPIKEDELRDKARNGTLRDCQFRSLCWRYFLRCLPKQYDLWLDSCAENRKIYDKIKAKNDLVKRITDVDDSQMVSQSVGPNKTDSSETDFKIDDADDDERQYQKATSLCDHKNVFRTIERDVVRTFPDMEFFRQTEIQGILENVLFNFASENPHLSYKQGMHELLAILLYVLHTDSQTCLITYEGGYANETIASLLDRRYLEHDVYHLFSALMKSIESWYQNDEILSMSNQDNTNRSTNTNSSQTRVGSVLGVKLNMISENIVKNYDLDLFNHLEALQIAPQIYGIRWMRLLFGREFEILDLLTVWDAIICDHVPMSLTEYIFASMLVTLRRELINSDYTDCLNNLMRHQFKDVQYVIKLALHLRDSKNFARPKPLYLGPNVDHNQASNRYASEANSLASKLNRQLASMGQQPATMRNPPFAKTGPASATLGQYSSHKNFMDMDNRDSKRMLSTPRPAQNRGSRLNQPVISSTSMSGRPTGGRGDYSAANKFLPNINKFVSSLGQNMQDITSQMHQSSTGSSASRWPQASAAQQRSSANSSHKNVMLGSTSSRSIGQPYNQHSGDHQQQQQHQHMMAVSSAREYEMREMMSTGQSKRGVGGSLPIGGIGSNHTMGFSSESYDDLHSIVDYCWRLLSEQIDSLQRCLPKEKSLHSEDEIFVALAQLKKVRDVLKGSLRLEDELESSPGLGKLQ